ncbi:fibropellin-1 [Patella vulgata]|uniref:fibropellin-1 n=1 Tax=Patella vulgata TaxID=6465 RepID=UPI00217F7048|nr:fibropellin-1 [Patella vulgata]
MYTSLILVYLAVALTFSSCTAHRERCSNSPRPEINLRILHCDTVEKFNLCRCCPVNPCENVECMNGGKCIGDGVCECVSGYSGPTCNINPCENVECMNGGKCVGEGFCECVSGYSGVTCNISPCDGVECLNGGQCVGEGVCNCTFGLGGATCNMRVCNLTECNERRGTCIKVRCTTNATNCGGKRCNEANDELCINDTCVVRGDICSAIDGILSNCFPTGQPCGEGTFCSNGFIKNKCVNETCRFVSSCDRQAEGASCTTNLATSGSCSGGLCLAPCKEDTNCAGGPCTGGFCAFVKCGESYCQHN